MRDLADSAHDKLQRDAKTRTPFMLNMLMGLAVGAALMGCGGGSPEAVDTGAASPQKVVAVNTVNSGHPVQGCIAPSAANATTATVLGTLT